MKPIKLDNWRKLSKTLGLHRTEEPIQMDDWKRISKALGLRRERTIIERLSYAAISVMSFALAWITIRSVFWHYVPLYAVYLLMAGFGILISAIYVESQEARP